MPKQLERRRRPGPVGLPLDPEHARERVGHYARQGRAANTRRAYAGDWQRFQAFCAANGQTPLPASGDVVAWYATTLADEGFSVSTIERAMAAIATAHNVAGLDRPTRTFIAQETLRGIRRELKVKQRQKKPVVIDDLRKMLNNLPDTLLGARDAALLAFGFASALRRSELVALDVADLTFLDAGVTVHVAKSKTDQEGAGENVPVSYAVDESLCPVLALQKWLAAAKIDRGPVFRSLKNGKVGDRLSAQTVAYVVKKAAVGVGKNPEDFGAHSLRAGFVTAAFDAGARETAIRAVTRHSSNDMVRRYVRPNDLFDVAPKVL